MLITYGKIWIGIIKFWIQFLTLFLVEKPHFTGSINYNQSWNIL